MLSKKYVQKIRERNYLLFHWKNITSPNLFKQHTRALTSKVLRHPGYLKIVLMAISKIRIVRKERNKEKKECKVSDEAIFAKF
jgi:hypothetical protein